MAERVDHMPGHGRSSYPWDIWLNGNVWKLMPGEDFRVSIGTMRSAAQQAAYRKGGRILTSYKPSTGDECLYLRFVPSNGDS